MVKSGGLFFFIVKPSSSTIMYVVSSEVSRVDHDLACPSLLTCSLSRRTRQLQNGASSSGWRAASSLVAPYSSWFSARVKSSGGPTVIRGQAESTSSSLLTSKTKARRLWIAPTPADGKHKRCDRHRWIRQLLSIWKSIKVDICLTFFFFHLKCWQMTQFWNFFLEADLSTAPYHIIMITRRLTHFDRGLSLSRICPKEFRVSKPPLAWKSNWTKCIWKF